VGVKPEIKANFAKAARRAGMGVTELFEVIAMEAIAKYLHGGRSRGNA
jgi:hypothetical protein